MSAELSRQGSLTTPTLTPGPDMGQHTEAVLLDLGYTWDDLAALKETGAIS